MRWWRPKLANLKRNDAGMARSAVKQTGKRGWEGEALDLDELPIKRRNKCYKIFPAGGKLFGGYAVELAFPIERTIEIMDRVIRLAEVNDKNKLFHTAPVALRFLQAAKAYASPQYGRDTVMFEVLMAKGTKGGEAALSIIEKDLLMEPDMRLHWGLNFDNMTSDNADLHRRYPKWDRFLKVFRRFNAKGTFKNSFTERIGMA